MTYRTFKWIYGILASALALSFFGHGAWAVFENKESFRELLSGTMNNVFGASTSIDDGAISAAVRAIGWWDIVFTVGILALAYGVIKGHGALFRVASSPVALFAYSWALLWGFLTAGSRVTAAGVFYPEVWDVVERGPNFIVPVAMLYMTYLLRRPSQLIEREEVPAEEKLQEAPTV
ncbi:MAG TPA: hypothetical protein VF097_11800 [Actinomycetota bacterium]